MPRTMADDLVSDVTDIYLDATAFGESAVYIPVVDPIADRRTITVIKDEANGGVDNTQHGRATKRSAVFHVAESATAGVLLPADGDIIVTTEGGQSVRWAFVKIVAHAAGMWSLECVTGLLVKQGQKQGGFR